MLVDSSVGKTGRHEVALEGFRVTGSNCVDHHHATICANQGGFGLESFRLRLQAALL